MKKTLGVIVAVATIFIVSFLIKSKLEKTADDAILKPAAEEVMGYIPYMTCGEPKTISSEPMSSRVIFQESCLFIDGQLPLRGDAVPADEVINKMFEDLKLALVKNGWSLEKGPYREDSYVFTKVINGRVFYINRSPIYSPYSFGLYFVKN